MLKRRRWAGVLVAALMVAACAPAVAVTVPDSGLDRLGRAITQAHRRGTFRLQGVLTSHGSSVAWDGFVAGRNEQYVTHALGLVIESRRVDGTTWARRLDQEDSWAQAPPDAPLDLDVLLRGHDVHSRRDAGGWRITLSFTNVDVLVALTHIPSVGPSTAEVVVTAELISDVSLQLGDGAQARLHFADYGAALTVTAPT